jgi:hypothetical protein
LFIKHIDNIDKIKSDIEGKRPGSREKRYQACVVRQCGQATVVETGARKQKPHSHT